MYRRPDYVDKRITDEQFEKLMDIVSIESESFMSFGSLDLHMERAVLAAAHLMLQEATPVITTYEHHGQTVFVDENLKGKHRSHCLCFKCERFKPGTPENCEVAQATYENCVKFNTTTPMYECPIFKEISNDSGNKDVPSK